MKVTLQIPDEIAAALQSSCDEDLGRVALECLVLDRYKAGILSPHQVQQSLGFENRFQTEEWLADRGAKVQYTLQDLEADRATLTRILGPLKPHP
jgi:hypothetical protein